MSTRFRNFIAAPVMAFALIASLAGCSSSAQPAPETPSETEEVDASAGEDAEAQEEEAPAYVDEEFVKAVAQCLDARGKQTDSLASDEYTSEVMDDAIKTELDAVEAYEGGLFEDPDLASAADEYIAALKASKGTDYTAYNNSWTTAYNQRVAALYKINEISPIEVSEDHKSTLNDLLATGEESTVAQGFLDTAVFEKEEPEYEGETFFTYSAVLENDSDINFYYFSFNINLLDADGVVVETQVASTDNWAPGTKHRFEFMTDAKFETIEVYSASWSL